MIGNEYCWAQIPFKQKVYRFCLEDPVKGKIGNSPRWARIIINREKGHNREMSRKLIV